MDVDSYIELIPLIMVAAFFFVSAIGAIYWASKRGQFRNFDEQARSIFTEEEPEGTISDSFPDKETRKN
ncbi:MAG: cbb3-type cytochrome oxidase assembly protein CcoS [Verrucomicrobiota bacterium]